MPPLERTSPIYPDDNDDDQIDDHDGRDGVDDAADVRRPSNGHSNGHIDKPGPSYGQSQSAKMRPYQGEADVNDLSGDGSVDGDTAATPETLRDASWRSRLNHRCSVILHWLGSHLNFYRIHLIFFTLIPLFAACFLWGFDDSNNPFINHLTVAVSAMTVTGLNPVLMEEIAHWQQAIIFSLSCIGSTTGVSLITIIIRKQFFRKKFDNLIQTDARVRKRVADIEARDDEKHRIRQFFAFNEKQSGAEGHAANGFGTPHETHSGRQTPSNGFMSAGKKRKRTKLRTDMIRRIDAPVRVNQMNIGGHLPDEPDNPPRRLSEEQARPTMAMSDVQHPRRTLTPDAMSEHERETVIHNTPRSRAINITEPGLDRRRRLATPIDDSDPDATEEEVSDDDDEAQRSQLRRSLEQTQARERSRRMSDPAGAHNRPRAASAGKEFKRVRTLEPSREYVDHASSSGAATPVRNPHGPLPRTHTIEIREPEHPVHRNRAFTGGLPHVGTMNSEGLRRRTAGVPLERTASRRVGVELSKKKSSDFPRTVTRQTAMTQGFGGFPNPVRFVAAAARDRIIAKTTTLDVPRTNTIQSVHSNGGLGDVAGGPTKAVSYITFDAVVGRNSKFYSLTAAQRDELGGVEYRALSLLLKIVAAYYILVQLIPMIIFAPVMQIMYRGTFQDQGTITNAGGWYAAFNVVSAYSNSGLSLLDESMTLFQTAYSWILTLCFCILAGNTAFPVFLRFAIWILSKLVPKSSRTHETLTFLLDHPRRCFIYLFPSHQTWLLLAVLIILNCTDWVCFLVLDIGNATLDALGLGTRMIDGFLQTLAVRSAGFAIVPLAQLAPAVKVLYVVMMYIAVYPVAISIRATNVYEEKSLGVFHDEETDSQVEEEYEKNHKAGSYFAHHARRQLAFDIWWLALALWAICIIERSEIDNPDSNDYFTVFTILFEIVSAYGTVGLSLGVPYANFSLCGGFRTLSKLILCAVMIRGRHRGLPVAIDRSILLPSDIEAMRNTRSMQRIGTLTMEDNAGSAAQADRYFSPGPGVEPKLSGGTLRKVSSRRMSVPGGPTVTKPDFGSFDQPARRPSLDINTHDTHPPQVRPGGGLNGYLETIYSAAPLSTATSEGGDLNPTTAPASSENSTSGSDEKKKT